MDSLGLYRVLFEAKRWSHQVGSPDVRGFIGALHTRRVDRGIFITTSTFSDSAREEAERSGNVRLLELALQMVRGELGVGWHMSSHALAFGLSVLAYGAARRFARDTRFAFGTWKIEVLGGYTSAVFLPGIAGLMLYQSVERLTSPTPIHYDQAIAIAVVVLLVNIACEWLLKGGHVHHNEHGRHGHHHRDLNLRAAYLHVLADATTSMLAILALIGGKYWGANWLEPGHGYRRRRPGRSMGLWAVG